MPQGETQNGLSSVDRALRLLDELAEHGPLGATELAHRLGTAKATAFRLARTLQARGYVVQNADSTYRLGPRCLMLATGVHASLDLRRDLLPVLDALRAETDETVQLTTLDGGEVVYVEQLLSTKPVLSVGQMGARAPAHCVSGGLAQLAAAPPDVVDRLLSRPLERFTAATITDPDEVRAELDADPRARLRHQPRRVPPRRRRRQHGRHGRPRPPGGGDQHLRPAVPPGGARRRPPRRARGPGGNGRQQAAGHADAGLRRRRRGGRGAAALRRHGPQRFRTLMAGAPADRAQIGPSASAERGPIVRRRAVPSGADTDPSPEAVPQEKRRAAGLGLAPEPATAPTPP